MRSAAITILAVCLSAWAFEPFFMKDPAVSPDGTKICFVYERDLWVVPFEGGSAKRISSVKGSASGPDYSPDGKYIAFNSDREGYNAIYYMPAEGGPAKKVITGDYSLVDWYNDSRQLLLTRRVPFTGNKLFRVNIDGSGITDLDAVGFVFGDLSKENDKFVFSHNGDPHREKMTGSLNGSLYIYDFGINSYYKIYDSPLTERYPVYSKTNKGIYFSRSDGEKFQICLLPYSEIGKPEPRIEQLTNFDFWSARDISIARENDRMAYEYFSEIWTLDPETGKYEKLTIEIMEDIFTPDAVIENNSSATDMFKVSPRGDWILFRYKFDLFAVPYEGGEIRRITTDASGVKDFAIDNDNETIYLTALVNGEPKLFRSSVKSDRSPQEVVWGKDRVIEGIKSVKGRLFVFFSEGDQRRMLAIKDAKKDDFIVIVKDRYTVDSEISADGNYVFYTTIEAGLSKRDLFIYDIRTGKAEVLYSHFGWMWGINLDPKEEFIFYNKDNTVYRSDMKRLSEFHFEKDKWKDIFEKKDNRKKEEKQEAVKSDFSPAGLKETEKAVISRAGDNYIVHLTKDQQIYYINELEKKYFLRKTDYEAKNDELITEIKGSEISNIAFSDSASALFYLQDGKIRSFSIKDKKNKDTPFSVNYGYNRQEIYWKVFDEVHSVFGRWFYDPLMHGVDWNGIKKIYSAYLSINLTSETLGSIVDEMIGEVNASHTGYYPKDEPEVKRYQIARTGAEYDLTSRLKKGLKVRKVFDGSVLKEVHGINSGDILISVDGTEISPQTDIDALFFNKTGEKISLVFEQKPAQQKTVVIKGLESDYDLAYRTWTNERTALVDKLSGGRIGYVHIRGMSEGPLQKFIDDLFTKNFKKDALIIDVRFNGGGYTHDELIEILTKKQYAYTSMRWDGNRKLHAPHNVWQKPSALLINRNSFSDAEIFPALYREFKLGKIIGTPTSGGVIGTGSYSLIDGSSMRLPRTGWFTKDGKNMEGSGVEPDIYVDPTFNQIINDDEPELKKAVEILLNGLK
jgi:tricorn protease